MSTHYISFNAEMKEMSILVLLGKQKAANQELELRSLHSKRHLNYRKRKTMILTKILLA